MTTIVGIDPSLASTGLAVWRDGRFYVSTLATRPGQDPAARHHYTVSRCLSVADPQPGHTLYVVEERITPGPDAVQTAMDLAELRGVINYGIHAKGHRRVDVHPGTLKVYATGNGRANKAAMLVAARGRLGTHAYTNNDDEADALWLVAIALHHYGLPLWSPPKKNLTAVGKPAWPAFLLTPVGAVKA